MAAHYKNISIEEMRDLLRPEKGWKQSTAEGNTKEAIFYYILKKHPFVHVRVYTGIAEGQSRKVGRDAIRVCAINLKTKSGWVKAKRVHRVEGWRSNLKSRVIQVIGESNARFDQATFKFIKK